MMLCYGLIVFEIRLSLCYMLLVNMRYCPCVLALRAIAFLLSCRLRAYAILLLRSRLLNCFQRFADDWEIAQNRNAASKEDQPLHGCRRHDKIGVLAIAAL